MAKHGAQNSQTSSTWPDGSDVSPFMQPVPELATGKRLSVSAPHYVMPTNALDEVTVKAIDNLLTNIRAHGYIVSELELSNLKLKLHFSPVEELSPAERLTMRRASENSYGARTARALGLSDD